MKEDKRVIKFRGKRIDNGEWVYGYYSLFRDNHAIMCDDGLWRKVIPESVGEFSGLLDKQGKEIYDGDFFKETIPSTTTEKFTGDQECFIIVWDENYAAFAVKRQSRDEGEEIHKDWMAEIEIIGNIYTHPELFTFPTSKQGK